MDGVDWSRVSDILADALDVPVAERSAYIRARCVGNPELLAAVERMQTAARDAGPRFLEGVNQDLVEAAARAANAPPRRAGPWLLLEEIGRGGMGQVFRAQRADGQFEQQVAIKLLKRGMDSDVILARFLRERQILAGLDHPNIARLLDGGITDDHRPYFVMELVEGMPVTAFADARRLSIDERLTLFRSVCDAVAHAHRNLVVHRDIKPTNILVTAAGIPKLLDFGIAKMLRSDAGEAFEATLTMDGARLLTPAYASPEQIAGGAVTTATDVYGLGAVLYELLSGRRPFGEEGDRFALPVDTEPAPLSAGVQSAGAAARASDPARLRHRLAGDLETIVAKALRAARDRRYVSVDALAEDLRRHQERLPVRARPDTLGYRTSRFVRRHRLEVVAAGLIVGLALAFGITATAQARALASERDRAQREAAAAREVSRFMVGVFEVADPMTPGSADTIRASDLLARGARRVDAELAGQPALQARLLGVIGQAYGNLRQLDNAVPVLARAVELERARDPPVPAALVDALHQLGIAHSLRSDGAEARSAIDEAIRIQEDIAARPVTMWALRVDQAFILHGAGDVTAANGVLSDAIERFAELPAESAAAETAVLARMAGMLGFGSDREREDSVFRRIAAIARAGGENGGAFADVLRNWANAKALHGDRAAADSLFERAIAIHETRDSTSLILAGLLIDRATYLWPVDPEGALPIAQRGVRLTVARLGDDHRQVGFARFTLAEANAGAGRVEAAIANFRASLNTLRRHPSDADLLPSLHWRLAAVLQKAGQSAEAEAEYARSLRSFQALFPDDYLLTANLRRDYGAFLVEVGRPAEAEPVLLRAIEVLAARWGTGNFRTDMPRIALAGALIDLDRAAEARALLRPVVDRLTDGRGADDHLTRQAREALDRIERPRSR